MISDNRGAGVLSEALTADALIEGNLIGVAADGATPLPNGTGLTLGREEAATPGAGDGFVVAGNRIAHNLSIGVLVRHTTGDVAIQGNEIFANGGLGIDFLGDGVSANGLADASALPHFPLLTAVRSVSAGTTVQGTIDHPAGHQVRIELFASRACDDSAHGQGETPLGTLTLTAPGGTAAFSALGASTPAGQNVVTATATDLETGRTSEFSRCFSATASPPPVAGTPPSGPRPGPGGSTPTGPVAGNPSPPIGLPPVIDPRPKLRCKVPKLAGLTLAKAKKRLRASGCGVGKVTRPKGRTRKGFRLVVKRASRKPRTIRRKGSAVGLTLGLVRKPRR